MQFSSSRRAGRRALFMFAAAFLAAAVACTEQDVGTQACPALCPNQNVVVLDTTFTLEIADTTLTGYPTFGLEQQMVLAQVGDTLDSRAIIRFDSLATAYLPPGYTTDSAQVAITNPDSAHLYLTIDTLKSHVPASFTINVYDVDTAVVDSITQAVVPLFRPSRLIGTRTFASFEWLDTVSIPIDTAKMRLAVSGPGRLRLGLQVVAPGADAFIRIRATESGFSPRLYYKAAPDSGATMELLVPRSLTPALFSTAQATFADWTQVVIGTPPPIANTIAVGGMPGRRPAFIFNLPVKIVDSSEVVRATLTLTQVPRRTYRDTDTTAIYPLVSTATTNVTDLGRAISFAQPLLGSARASYSRGAWTDSLSAIPRDSGQIKIELTAIVRQWRVNSTLLQRIIALRVSDEGFTQADFRYFSTKAAANLRPSMRIQYIPRPTTVTP
jgi:hypothetical protein